MPKLKKPQKAKVDAPPQAEAKTMTVMQVASSLQISRSKAYELVRGEGFPKIRIGRRLLVPEQAFGEWLEENTHTTY